MTGLLLVVAVITGIAMVYGFVHLAVDLARHALAFRRRRRREEAFVEHVAEWLKSKGNKR